MNRNSACAISLALTFAAGSAGAEGVLANEVIKEEINKSPTAKAAVLKALGVNDPTGWSITSAETTLKTEYMKVQLPSPTLQYITSEELINCEDTSLTREFTLAKEVTNSLTLTATQTLGISAELGVSIEVPTVGGVSAKVENKFEVSSSQAATHSATTKLEDKTTVAFDKRGGRIVVLQAMTMDTSKIPWTASFVPEDQANIKLHAERDKGTMCIFKDAGYKGDKTCFDAPVDEKHLGLKWNNRVSSIQLSGATVEVFQIIGFRGNKKTFDDSTSNVGEEWNDKISAFKLTKKSVEKSIMFGSIKASLPERARRFTASGTMDVVQTKPEGKRITSYALSDADVKAACSNAPTLSVSSASVSSAADKKPGATAAGGGIRQRTLPKDEAMRRIATARKL